MIFQDWGLIDYQEALNKQMQLVEAVQTGGEEVIVFCSHPSVVTLGRASSQTDIQGWAGNVVQTTRGGKATYHGPGQLVVYPIIDLARPKKNLKPKDIHNFLKTLEDWTIDVLEPFCITAKGGMSSPNSNNDLIFTGVWHEQHKLASIGIGVKKWVTYHGLALNVKIDPQAFTGINPCGFSTEVMSSLEGLGHHLTVEELKSQFQQTALKRFSG